MGRWTLSYLPIYIMYVILLHRRGKTGYIRHKNKTYIPLI